MICSGSQVGRLDEFVDEIFEVLLPTRGRLALLHLPAQIRIPSRVTSFDGAANKPFSVITKEWVRKRQALPAGKTQLRVRALGPK
jgi:hypothetical protein